VRVSGVDYRSHAPGRACFEATEFLVCLGCFIYR
jgi:hypothetical protein